jgi:hypothetical protein
MRELQRERTQMPRAFAAADLVEPVLFEPPSSLALGSPSLRVPR